MTRGRIEAIWIKRAHRGPMDPVTRATLRAGRGIVGNADQGGRRQITFIDRQHLGSSSSKSSATHVDPAARRANLLVGGLSLAGSRGMVLRVGRLPTADQRRDQAVRAHGRGPGRASARADAAWRGGAYAEVLDDGEIEVGAPVEWAESKE